VPTPLDIHLTLLQSGTLSPLAQERILRHAVTGKKYAVLAQLAHHPELTTGIDDRILAVNNGQVRAAWLTRPGRPVADIVATAQDDTRIPVCAALAGLAGLPAGLYETAAAKANPLVDVALLTNPAVPGHVKTQPLLRHAATEAGKKWGDLNAVVLPVLRAHPDVTEHVVQVSKDLPLLNLCASVDPLTTAAGDRLITLVIGRRHGRIAGGDTYFRSMTANLIRNQAITGVQLRRLCAEILDEDRQVVEPLRDTHWETAADLDRIVAQRLDLEDQNEPECIDELVARATSTGNRALGETLLTDLRITAAHVTALREELKLGDFDADVFQRFEGRPDVQAALLTDKHSGIHWTRLQKVGDPAAVLLAELRAGRFGSYTFTCNANLFTDAHLRALPAEALSRNGYEKLRPAIGKLISATLTTTAMWEVFETMAVTDDVLLGDCLDTATLV
jgi:antitoxin (DNA-binding transcriptional repressor) of toxin-antitoxin stability system